MPEPSYLALHRSGELALRAREAVGRLSECRLCPRDCGVDRLDNQTGFCRTGRKAIVASYSLHFGEEAPLVGQGGSGTIFFAECNLGCVFCQNSDISWKCADGIEAEPDELAGVMLELQRQGAHNINFVTPSHVVPQILEALPIAADHGLRLPLVYNSSGYDGLEALALLRGVVDIYMPDAKFWDSEVADRFMRGAKDYPERARAAIREMFTQVGDLRLDEEGVATRGLLVRHLVMPQGLAGTGEWMRFLAGLSTKTYVNVMDQYRPCFLASERPGIDRAITSAEMRQALDLARQAGLERLDDRRDRVYRMVRNLL